MNDLISREELERNIKERFCATCNNYDGIKCRACLIDDCLDEVESAPTVDAVEVVRCKDCIFWGDEDGILYNEHLEKRCSRCRAHNYVFNGEHWGWCPTEDDYCSFGERKEVIK